MDKNLMMSRFSKSARSYNNDAEAQQKVARRMIHLLQPYIENGVQRVVEIGCGTGIYSRLLIEQFAPQHFILNDIVQEMEQHCADILTHKNYSFIACDAEQWELPQQIDLLTSCSTFQWFRDLDVFFQKAHTALSNNGVFAFSTFGEENLCEISRLTGHSLRYTTLVELSEMLSQIGFSTLCAKEEKIVLTFDAPKDVLIHMKRTGVNGISQQKWTKSTLQRFSEQYISDFSVENDKFSLTYHPMYFICRKSSQNRKLDG
jgi:malonyl-ACP O-methyltransferase BioC